MSEICLRSSSIRRPTRRTNQRFFSYFQAQTFRNIFVVGFLCLTVPTHQIPNRLLLLQALWHRDTKSIHLDHETAAPFHLRRTPAASQRCRPCMLKKTQALKHILQSVRIPGSQLRPLTKARSFFDAALHSFKNLSLPVSFLGRSPPLLR